MRTLIVFLCFCRLHGWGHLVDITKEDVENNLHGSLLHDNDLATYLRCAVHLTTESALFTANFEKLNKCLRSVQDSEGNRVICLRGPKGLWENFHTGYNICVIPYQGDTMPTPFCRII